MGILGTAHSLCRGLMAAGSTASVQEGRAEEKGGREAGVRPAGLCRPFHGTVFSLEPRG